MEVNHRLRYLGLVLLCLCTSIGAECRSQTVRPEVESTKVLAAVGRWARGSSTYRPDRRTVLFSLTLNGCTPCAISAVNDGLRTARGVDSSANLLVVVAAREPKEGVALRRKFVSKNVAEDTDRILDTLLHAHSILADAFVIDTTGSILMYHHDLPHNELDSAVLSLALHAPASSLQSSVLPVKIIALREEDDAVITDAHSASLDSASGTLRFLDRKQNAIYAFDALTGKRIAAIEPDSTIAFHFRKATDNQAFWRDLADHFSSLVNYSAVIFPSWTDTTYILGELFSGYSLEIGKRNGRDTEVHWDKATCLLASYKGHVVDVHQLAEQRYMVVGDALPLGHDIISESIWEGLIYPDVSDQQIADSCYQFLVMGTNGLWAKPVVHGLPTLTRSDRGLKLALGEMCVSEKGELYYLNPHTHSFIKGVRSGDSIAATSLKPAGSLTTFVKDSSTTEDDSLRIESIAAHDGRVYVLAVSGHADDDSKQLLVQSYDTSGRFLGEHTVVTGDDTLLAAHAVGFSDSEMGVLIKQRNARWGIWWIGLSDL